MGKSRKLPKGRKKAARSRLRRKKATAADVIEAINGSSYYNLSPIAKRLAKQAENGNGLEIQGWSFTPNPQILSSIYKDENKFIRFIVLIETLRADIYDAVAAFLDEHRININSYYTGGSSDFICDIQVTVTDYQRFYSNLQAALRGAGVEKLEDVQNLVSIFRVEEPLILCKKKLSDLGNVDTQTLQLIQSDLVRFEVVCRDYRSKEAIAALRTQGDLRKYINALEKGHAIIGFHARMNVCRFVIREYVPVCGGGRFLDKLLKQGGSQAQAILANTVELLKVAAAETTDATDRAVTHIFVNEYKTPGDRNQWRRLLYKALGGEVNAFTIPLEGTINQSPIILSDLPEAIAEARHYKGQLHLGYLNHPSGARMSEKVCLQPGMFANQGVTLGLPGTGKTNSDCILVEEALKHLKRVLVIDCQQSHSIRDKEMSFSPELRERIKYVTIVDGSSPEELLKTIKSCVLGCYVIEASTNTLPSLLEVCLKEIGESTTNSGGNVDRVVDSLLLVEESNDVLGKDVARRRLVVGLLDDMLNKAYRMGWCIWLSTQHPVQLGYDESSALKILRSLQNKVIHQLDPAAVPLVKQCLQEDGSPRFQKKLDQLASLPRGVALVSGTARTDGKVLLLPPIFTNMRLVRHEAAPAKV